MDFAFSKKEKTILFVVFDSSSPTQTEFLEDLDISEVFDRITGRLSRLEIVKVDVRTISPEMETYIEKLGFQNSEHVSNKNKPSFAVRVDNQIHKVAPETVAIGGASDTLLNEKYRSIQYIHQAKDLADALSRGNKSLESVTILYCRDKEALCETTEAVALNLLRYETSNKLLVVSDSDVAKKLKVEPGRFYAYYKPSFVNGFEQYVEVNDINFDYL